MPRGSRPASCPCPQRREGRETRRPGRSPQVPRNTSLGVVQPDNTPEGSGSFGRLGTGCVRHQEPPGPQGEPTSQGASDGCVHRPPAVRPSSLHAAYHSPGISIQCNESPEVGRPQGGLLLSPVHHGSPSLLPARRYICCRRRRLAAIRKQEDLFGSNAETVPDYLSPSASQESPHFRCLRSSPDSSMLRRSFGSCRNGAWAWAKRGSWVVGLRRFGGSSLGCMGMTCTPSALMRWQVPRWG